MTDESIVPGGPAHNFDAAKQKRRANLRLAVLIGAVAFAVYLLMIARLVL